MANLGEDEDVFVLSVGILMEDIWVIDSECEECKRTNKQYNTTAFGQNAVDKKAFYENDMLSLEMQGNRYNDFVKIGDYGKVKFPFVVCDKFVDVLGLAFDGIIGLGTNKSSIVYKMFEEQLIDEPTYSLSFLNNPYLILGTPNFLSLSLVVESQQSIKYESPFTVTEFRFGDYLTQVPVEAEFSSISSYITGPPDILESVFKEMASLGCHYEEEILMCDCGEEYPELEFVIQGERFTLASKHYFIQLGDNCFMGFKSGNHWVLGEPFLKGYFFEFELKQSVITLYRTSALDSNLPSPLETTEGWALMFILTISSIGIYVFFFVIYHQYEHYKVSLNISLNKKKPHPL